MKIWPHVQLFFQLRLLSTLMVCITNTCHWNFHQITIIWSIILDWPYHSSKHVTYFIYHCFDALLSLKVFIKIFINFTHAQYTHTQYMIWWSFQQYCVRETIRAAWKQHDCTSINPVGPPSSSSSHKVKKLGTKWSKLLGTRTKLRKKT